MLHFEVNYTFTYVFINIHGRSLQCHFLSKLPVNFPTLGKTSGLGAFAVSLENDKRQATNYKQEL